MKAEIIEVLLSRAAAASDCVVRPAAGRPIIPAPHLLPDDLMKFYDLCAGVQLYGTAAYPVSIVMPHEIVPANPVIRGEQIESDISASWYVLADDMNGDYFTIDLCRDRMGRCYDSFWDSHTQVGDCKIIADSFTDFLMRMLNNAGKHWYFLQPDFASLGDAYD